MIALLFALSFADVTASAVADRQAVRLSESVRLTLTVEGPAPLAVTVPDEWLTAESAANWRARPVDSATVTPLPDGRERWALTVRLDPYATGDPLPVTLSAARVRSGSDPTLRRVDWSTPAINVSSEIGEATADDARPVTGIESVPDPARKSIWPWLTVGVFVLLLAVAVAIRARMKSSHPHTDIEIVARTVRDIEVESDPRELARLAAEAVRNSLGRTYVFRSTAEIRRDLERNENAREETDPTSLLTLCDRVHFDPSAAGLADELKSRTLDWLRSR